MRKFWIVTFCVFYLAMGIVTSLIFDGIKQRYDGRLGVIDVYVVTVLWPIALISIAHQQRTGHAD